jgi:uncharacterized protein (TIGR02172 family)
MNKESIGQGRTAEVFPADDGRIIKLYRQFISKEMAENEFAMAQCAYDNGIKTPRPYSIGMYEDRCGIVYERVSGKTLLQVMMKNPLKTHSAARKLAALHYSIHQICIGTSSTRQKTRLRDAITIAPVLNDKQTSQILEYTDALPDGHTLCHGDFHPDNIIVDGNASWIIDWMTGCEGNAACDVARTAMILKYSALPEQTPRILKLIVRFQQEKLSNWYKNEYMRISGLQKQEIDRWLLPNYAARLVENLSADETEILIRQIKHEIKKMPCSCEKSFS